MEKLQFITKEGVVGLACEWESDQPETTADNWLYDCGEKLGKEVVPAPHVDGFIDLSQFAAAIKG